MCEWLFHIRYTFMRCFDERRLSTIAYMIHMFKFNLTIRLALNMQQLNKSRNHYRFLLLLSFKVNFPSLSHPHSDVYRNEYHRNGVTIVCAIYTVFSIICDHSSYRRQYMNEKHTFWSNHFTSLFSFRFQSFSFCAHCSRTSDSWSVLFDS